MCREIIKARLSEQARKTRRKPGWSQGKMSGRLRIRRLGKREYCFSAFTLPFLLMLMGKEENVRYATKSGNGRRGKSGKSANRAFKGKSVKREARFLAEGRRNLIKENPCRTPMKAPALRAYHSGNDLFAYPGDSTMERGCQAFCDRCGQRLPQKGPRKAAVLMTPSETCEPF